jgi:hypothetical protein
MFGEVTLLINLFPPPLLIYLSANQIDTLLISMHQLLHFILLSAAFSGIEATEDKVESKPATSKNVRSPSGRVLSKKFSSRGDRFWSNIVPSFIKRDHATTVPEGQEHQKSSFSLFSCCCGKSNNTEQQR